MTGSYKKGGIAAAGYYVEADDDYYTTTKGGEPPGIWYRGVGPDGTRDTKLGYLHGQSFQSEEGADTLHHETEKYFLLIYGVNPSTGRDIVQNAGSEKRVAFHDFTLSAPKSVSVLWSQATEYLRESIQQAQHDASLAFLDFMGTKALAREGAAGVNESVCPLNAAMFHHGSSRANDPQLHTHNVVFNVAERANGTFGALETRQMMSWQGAAVSLYHADLAYSMRQLGFTIDQKGNLFEVAGVPDNVLEAFSQRRSQILTAVKEELEARGMDGTQAASAIHRGLRNTTTISTRAEKTEITQAEIRLIWAERGKALGFTEAETTALIAQGPIKPLTQEELLKAAEAALDQVAETKAYFKEADIVARVAIGLTGKANRDEILWAAEEVRSKLLVAELHDEEGSTAHRVYTTKKMYLLEREMLAMAAAPAPEHALDTSKLALPESLAEEQRAAVLQIAESDKRVSVLEGTAGAGKSFTMASVARAFEGQGYKVVGLAAAHEQARGLAESADIKAHAITGWSHAVARGREALDDKTVMIVDEAGMIGSSDMHKLLKLAEQRGSKVILLGDTLQQKAVGAGDALRHIVVKNKSARLNTIRRQKSEADRQAVYDFFAGKAKEGLESYNRAGLIKIEDSAERTDQALIADWNLDRTRFPSDSQLMIAASNKAVTKLNRMAHDARKEAGELGESISLKTMQLGADEEMEFSVGDDVVFRVNSNDKVVNRTRGKILAIYDEKLLIETKDSTVEMNTADPKWQFIGLDKKPEGLALQHAYATTVYSSQGATVNRAYVRDSAGFQRDQVGVMFSRHIDECKGYVDKQARWEAKMNRLPAEEWHPLSEFSNEECLGRVATAWSKESKKSSTLDFDQWTTSEGIPVDPVAEAAIAEIKEQRGAAEEAMWEAIAQDTRKAHELRTHHENSLPRVNNPWPFQEAPGYALDQQKPSKEATANGVDRLTVEKDVDWSVVEDAQSKGFLTFSENGDPIFQGLRPDGQVVFTAEGDKPRMDGLRINYPPILEGDRSRVDIVSTGMEALFLRTLQHAGQEPESTIIVNHDDDRALEHPHVQMTIGRAAVVARHDNSKASKSLNTGLHKGRITKTQSSQSSKNAKVHVGRKSNQASPLTRTSTSFESRAKQVADRRRTREADLANQRKKLSL